MNEKIAGGTPMSVLTYIAGENPFLKITNELWYQGEVQILPFPKEQILPAAT